MAETNSVYVGESSVLGVVPVPGETYMWELYTKEAEGINITDMPGNCHPADAYFKGGNTGPSVNVTWLTPGIYYFKVTAWQAGCSMNIKVGMMTVLESPLVTTVNYTSVNCFGDNSATAAITVSGGTLPYTYSWNDPMNQITAKATGLCAGIPYTVVVKDRIGFSKDVTVNIPGPDELMASAVVDNHVSCDDHSDGRATVMATGGVEPYSYLWSDPAAQGNATATGLTATGYKVTVTDGNGCQASDSAFLHACEVVIWMPNAFSPKGDKDKFRPVLNPEIPIVFKMMIFNKWGELIFTSTDVNEGWDGTFKGELCPPDMYVWIINFEAPESYSFRQKSPQKGTVMLLK